MLKTNTITKSTPIPINSTSYSTEIKPTNRFNNQVNANIVERKNLQSANAMFDPKNASPNTEFIKLLNHRMNVYYDQDVCIFS